ncbi:MAG: cob(I)yrinic acid a,c-diamide adenosyltransferase [Nitrospirae bacterium GWD2_57_9]|nr:MAG: cob(I)yrinic acid a,c-diamide adenosyltransferase [Nitrospirae bacterium GWD2_57_9]
MRKGYIQVYTGNGKGKTTAALGLAVRAAGAGMRTFIAQFIKKKKCSEHALLEELNDRITIRQYGKGFLLRKKPSAADIQAAKAGYQQVKEKLLSREYEVVILDEANVAVHYGLISAQDILDLIAVKPKSVELVITGRYACDQVVAAADLVTEMREVKHYRQKGVEARRGIEK